ncbi:MAG: valine--tRNA ligase [Phycisphaeraceae bacterium]
MPTELATRYTPADIEPAILQRWNDARAFHAEPTDAGPPYSIVIPPPNVTAALHMGHALNNTLQDILIRWRRMAGDNAVWLPGTDHAGIATQTVVEKRVLKEEGKRRTEFQRDEFVAKIQAWKDEYEATITNQLKTMGCSCDWERQAFTMDETRAKAVREAFFQLFRGGLIYRGKRLVNWDPVTQTALADDEVEMEEIDGHFYYLRYPLAPDKSEIRNPQSEIHFVTVATTRPETMLGDSAVAINPRDPRAAALRGRKVRLPIVNREVPIIEDEYVVLPDPDGDEKARYSSGFLKVTPAHDPNDWELGLKYNLPQINVLAPDATISDKHGWPEDDRLRGGDLLDTLIGLDRYEARQAIVEWFRQNDLLEDVKPYRHSVGHSYRSHVAIEPYLSDQWYVATKKQIGDAKSELIPGTDVPMNSLAGYALRAMDMTQRSDPLSLGERAGVRGSGDERGQRSSQSPSDAIEANPRSALSQAPSPQPSPSEGRGGQPWEGQLRFIPDRYARTFQAWHENLRDWCISRQLWWGHRIPVWTRPSMPAHTYAMGEPDLLLAKLFEWHRQDRLVMQGAGRLLTGAEKIGKDALYFVCVRNDSDSEITDLLESEGFVQDPDVLDTWFSSALWPMSTLGWPDDTPELRAWNPTSTLSTAREIITLWVSRMTMFNIYFRSQVPFKEVFIHAMIQDGEGRKMSKSLGNGVDPLDIIHSHGSDGMRFTLAQMTTQTQDVRLPVVRDTSGGGTGRNTSEKFDAGRNFANKLWNATRFALQNLEGASNNSESPPAPRVGDPTPGGGGLSLSSTSPSSLALADTWILSRLARVVHDSTAALQNFEFSSYAQGLYDFIWRDLCDWYIEVVKPTLRDDADERDVLALCLDVSLRLLHPVMPFVTEALWEHLNAAAPDRHEAARRFGDIAIPPSALLIRAAWPGVPMTLMDPKAEEEFGLIQQAVSAVRQVRTLYKVPPRQKVKLSAKVPAAMAQKAVARPTLFLETLANVEVEEIGPKVDKPADAAVAVVGLAEFYLHGLIEADAEKARLSKRLEELDKSIKTLEGRLGNAAYVDKAPPHLVQQTREQLEAAQREARTVREQLAAL